MKITIDNFRVMRRQTDPSLLANCGLYFTSMYYETIKPVPQIREVVNYVKT